MNAETMIKEYWEYKKETEILKNQLLNFRGVTEVDMIEAMNFSRPHEERVQKSGVADKTAKIALNYHRFLSKENEDLYRFIFNKYKCHAEEIMFFESAVDLLPDNLSLFIKDMIFNKLSWDELSYKYDVSRRTIGRYRRKAINKLNEIYDCRSQIEIEYMLS
ncbi:MAG: hypothetical protein Q4D26_01635 [Clostridia bacterium]|nr:hypothetical protein [Clostridia bacterium]